MTTWPVPSRPRPRPRLALAIAGGSISGRDDPGPLDHEDHGPLRGARPMHHPLRHGDPLPRQQLDRPAFQVDHEAPLDDIEALVLRVVLVPVELSLYDAEPHHAVI